MHDSVGMVLCCCASRPLLQVSPSPAYRDFFRTTAPRNTAIGAVFIVSGAGLAFFLFDWIASGYLREVIISSVRQHAARTEELWALASRQLFARTVCWEMGGPASALVGGIDMLRRTRLDDEQKDILARQRTVLRVRVRLAVCPSSIHAAPVSQAVPVSALVRRIRSICFRSPP